jgi:hypothetical protein
MIFSGSSSFFSQHSGKVMPESSSAQKWAFKYRDQNHAGGTG